MKVTFKDWMVLFELSIISKLYSIVVYCAKMYMRKALKEAKRGNYKRFTKMNDRVNKIDKLADILSNRGEKIIETQKQKGFNV